MGLLPKHQKHQMRVLVWCFFLWTSAPLLGGDKDSTSIPTWAGKLGQDSVLILAGVDKDSIRNTAYTQFGDLLRRSTSFTPLSQGSLGQRDGIDILGFLPNEQVLTTNGVPMYSASIGGFHPLYIAPATVERFEILAGTEALGTLPMLSLAGINVQRKQYNSARPFTSMWYHQGAGDLVAGNVAFAQNVSREYSIAANVRRMGARGVYQQTDFDAWNVQVQNRYNVNDASTVTLTYDLTTIDADAWGGVASDPYGTTGLIENLSPKYPSARDVMRRHDVSLMHTYQNTRDSSFRIGTSVFMSADAHKQGDTTTRGGYAGVLSAMDYQIGQLVLHGGLNLDDYAHGWMNMRYLLMPQLSVISSVRYDAGTTGGIGYGAALQFRDSLWAAKIDGSRISRSEGVSSHSLLYAHVMVRQSGYSLQSYLYYKTSSAPFQGGSGGIVTFATNVGSFECMGTVRGIIHDTAAAMAPMWYGNLRLTYVYHTGASTIRLGAECGLITSGALPQYDLSSRSYSTLPMLESPQQIDGLSIFARFNVGTASVRASFDNLLGNRWYTVAYMPEIPRQFRLSVDWTFVD